MIDGRGVVGACLTIALVASGCLGGAAPADERTPGVVKLQAPGDMRPVPAGEYKFDGAFAQVLTEGPYKELGFNLHFIPSAIDGADIEIGVWRPDVPAGMKVPVIVDAGPYYGAAGAGMDTRSRYILMMTTNYISHGYAVTAISVRGTGGSGGCMDLMGNKESADLDQAVTWLGTQEWSNGKVGMIGRSYDGSTPWSAAYKGNPHLRTVVPVSGVPDVYGLMFRNGSSEERGLITLNALYYAFFATSPADDPLMEAEHLVQGAVCPESFAGFAAAMYSGVTGARDTAGWWVERNHKPHVEEHWNGSVLMVQGLQDWNVDPGMNLPWADDLQRKGLVVHQMLGQWGHEFPDQRPTPGTDPAMRWDWAQILLNWWDYWLMDKTTIDLGPAIQIQDTSGKWHFDEHYPPRDADWKTYHLGTGSRLTEAPTQVGSVLLLPNQIGDAGAEQLRETPGFKADFLLPPAETDLTFSGLPRVHVTVTPAGPTGHLAAWLYSVSPSGDEQPVGWTTMNLQFADGTETPKALTPNQPVLAKMQIQPLDVRIPAGDRLMLRIWQYADHGRMPAFPPEPITLGFGGTIQSTLELPVIDRDASYYFEPPRPPA
jgi:predicted acyl esterase